VEKLKVDDLNPAEQLELESILQAHRQGREGDTALTRKFYSSFQDAFAWWLFLLLGSVGGFIAIFIAFSPHEIAQAWRLFPSELKSNPVNTLEWSFRNPTILGPPVCLIVAIWTTLTIARNYKRRGVAATSFATVRVRGKKLALLRHAEVQTIKWEHMGSSGKTFSALTLTPAEGKRLHVYANAAWVEVAIQELNQSRAAAGLPQITPTVEWGPHYRVINVQPSNPAE
jgi:hypothetical protein